MNYTKCDHLMDGGLHVKSRKRKYYSWNIINTCENDVKFRLKPTAFIVTGKLTGGSYGKERSITKINHLCIIKRYASEKRNGDDNNVCKNTKRR